MTDPSARSPKRAHILASINPLLAPLPADKERSPPPPHRSRRKRSRSQDEERRASEPEPGYVIDVEKTVYRDGESELPPPRATKFRFKSKSKSSRDKDRSHRSRDHEHDRRSRSRSRDRSPISSSRTSRRHHRPRHRHHHRRRRSASPALDPDADPYAPAPLDPDVAFREALFDAMADDEGAAYWEGVYGQPLHVYERDGPSGDGGGDKGPLERMTDEEYAEHVRQRMWEKTHAGLLEARERRKAERAAREEREGRRRKESERIRRDVERSLRAGEERRAKRGWRDKWDTYVAKWEVWDGTVGNVPWPVETGIRKDVGSSDAAGKEAREAVRMFFTKGLQLEESTYEDSAARLKDERVRWHPDKMQQKLGGKVEPDVMRDITAIFQVVDQLWNDIRGKLPRSKA